MACYIQTVEEPSRAEFEEWRQQGYTGKTYEEYLEHRKECPPAGTKFFMCGGKFGSCCSDCMGVGELLCDYPVGDGKTCDRIMCAYHAHEVAPEIHYCEGHYQEWVAFRDSGGVAEHLKNVVAFKR